MAHYSDGSPYTYAAGERALVNAGWLGRGRAFPRGKPRAGFLDRVAWRSVSRRDRATRGFHVCDLCPGAALVFVVHEGERYLLGSAEITVEAGDKTYAAPDLVLHYVAQHGYRPPDDFVEALLSSPAEESLSNWSLLRDASWLGSGRTGAPSTLAWNTGGWLGAQIGCTLWLLILGGVLLRRDTLAAWTCWSSFLVLNAWGIHLWRRRERLSAYAGLQLFLLAASAVIAGVVLLVNTRGLSEPPAPGALVSTYLPPWVIAAAPALMLRFFFRERRAKRAG